jgi:polar amino acid transport system permease protein
VLEFTTWDILRNLLLAARWTVLLSIIAFVAGGLVGLAVLVARVAPLPPLQKAIHSHVPFPGREA